MSEATDWDNLPQIVLCKVYTHLDLQDRYSASQVSKTWSLAFRSPELWHKMKFECFNDEMIPIKFVQSLGEYLWELKMDCRLLDKKDKNESLFEYFLRFFTISAQKQMNLKKFTFRNLELSQWKVKEDLRCKMLGVISDFLATQTADLTHLDLANCEAPPGMGLDLLNKLADPGKIRKLDLEFFFGRGYSVLNAPNYQEIISSFKSLICLSINYNCIDSNVLKLIVGNCSRSLEIIQIIYSGEGPINHVIPNETWTLVRKMCPKLKVDVRFVTFFEDTDCINIIPPEMRLRSLTAYFSYINDTTSPLLIHLCQFWETLEEVKFMGLFSKFEDGHLIELVSKCPELKTFSFHGPNECSIETVKKMSEMQLNGDIKLDKCVFTRTFSEEKNQTVIEEIHKLNELIKQLQGFEFTLYDRPIGVSIPTYYDFYEHY